MSTNGRDFPIMARYYREPERNWDMNWTELGLIASGFVLAALILLAWALGRF